MLRVVQYRTWEEVEQLREQWNSLLQHSAADTVFLTWQWCEAWWKNYGNGRLPFVLAAWDGTKLIGVAPLFIEPVRRYGSWWRCLRLIGDGSQDSDYLDCFVERGRENETILAFGDFLHVNSKSWDWIEVTGALQDSPTISALMTYAQGKNWRFETEIIPCSVLPLPKTWDEYLRMLEPRFRTKVRSAISVVTDILKTSPTRCVTEHQITDWLPHLFELHTRRWGSRSMPGVFRDPAKRQFYADLSRAALEQGWLAFHELSWSERPLAYQYGLIYQNRFHLLQEGYDPDFSDLRPGVALRAWLMRESVRASLREYDFLAGVSQNKLDWGAQKTQCLRLSISARPAPALVVTNLPRFQSSVRQKLSEITPEPLLAWRKQMIAGRKRRLFSEEVESFSPAKRGSWVRRLASVVYSSSPLGTWGRSVASRYCWSAEKGALHSLQRRPGPVCQIFQYHRVNDDRDPFLAALPVSTFRAHMQHLAANFPVLSLDQLSRGEFPEGCRYCVAVTFDDGYRDNFVCALPVLKDLGIPATVFLATGFVDSGQLPWYDQVRLAFKLTTRREFSLTPLGGPAGRLPTMSDRVRSAEQVLGWLRRRQEAERKAGLDELFRMLGVPSDLNLPNQMLKWEEIRQMAKANISFGAHTISHPVLSKIPDSDLEHEIRGSKRAIENRLQTSVLHFAYPFGQPFDFSVQAKQMIRDSGFKTAATTVWGLNEPADDLYELRRFTPWETHPSEFQLKLDWYRFSMSSPSSLARQERAPCEEVIA